jgi:hypothetical protein
MRMMTDPLRGAFGGLGPRYELTDEAVVVAKRWEPALLAPALPLGVWVSMQAFGSHVSRVDGKLYIVVGIVGILVGILGLVRSPLLPPARIVATPGELLVGGKRYHRDEVVSLQPALLVQHGRYGTRSYFWSLQITLMDARTIKMRLARGGEQIPSDVEMLIDALRGMLAGEAPPARQVVRATRGPDGNFTIDPRDAAAFQAMLAAVPAMPQWAPDGVTPRVLTEPLAEPSWHEHIASGTERQRARYGSYFVRIVEPAAMATPAKIMSYRFRLFVHVRENDPPVLAINAESSSFGTTALGVHQGGTHINYGPLEDDSYDDFVARARALLDEILGEATGRAA